MVTSLSVNQEGSGLILSSDVALFLVAIILLHDIVHFLSFDVFGVGLCTLLIIGQGRPSNYVCILK
jgi:hypothetical protein